MLTHLHAKPILPTRVVILGAGGFVSSAAQRRLEALNVPVLALTQYMLDLTHQNAGIQLASLLHPDDTLVFVAAKAPVKSEAMLIENLIMCQTVCEALKKIPVNHVVYISSDAVYANSDSPLTEFSCAQPDSLHGVMHLAREVMLSNACQGSLCFLRPTLIYGKDDPHNGYGPNRFLRLAMNGEDIMLFGEGEERRDHVYIEDVAEIIRLVILHRSSGILNIASGVVTSFKEIAEMIFSKFNSPTIIKNIPRKGLMPHGGYKPFNNANCQKAFPEFQFTSLEKGLEKSYNCLK